MTGLLEYVNDPYVIYDAVDFSIYQLGMNSWKENHLFLYIRI